MSSRSSSRILVVAITSILLAGAGIYLLTDRYGGTRDFTPFTDEPNLGPAVPSVQLRRSTELIPPVQVTSSGHAWNQPSSVLWPLRVELELLQADYLPTADNVPPIGTGKAARLSGRLVGEDDVPVAGQVEFIAGPNKGRVLYCDDTGAFGASDLYPGLAIVDVRGPGVRGARREVRLRQNSETLLNIGFGLLAPVTGRVVNRQGEAVQGARVVLDGQSATTGVEGEFHFGGIASGHCVAEVTHPDYATFLRITPVSAGRPTPPGKLVYTLEKSTTLSISTPSPEGGPGPTLVYLLPASTARQRFGVGPDVDIRRYPWYLRNPIEVPTGTPVRVDDLPAEVVKVMAFRPGATAVEQIVNLRPDRVNTVQLQVRKAPLLTGVVTFRDQPLAGVEVTLEAPDQVRANLAYLRQPSTYLESEIMPYLPPAQQKAITNHEGRYTFTSWSDLSTVRFLEARGPASSWAGRLVQPGDERIDLVLESVELGDSALVLELPGRHQGLPVELTVNGAPKDPWNLAPHDDFVVEPLVAGRWKLVVSWNSDQVHREGSFVLDGQKVIRVGLPVGALEGQDREAWRRAGREWPF